MNNVIDNCQLLPWKGHPGEDTHQCMQPAPSEEHKTYVKLDRYTILLYLDLVSNLREGMSSRSLRFCNLKCASITPSQSWDTLGMFCLMEHLKSLLTVQKLSNDRNLAA